MNWQKLWHVISQATGIAYRPLPHVGDDDLMKTERRCRVEMHHTALTIKEELRRTEEALRR